MNKFYGLFFLFLFFLFNQKAFSQAGKDGARTITALNTVVNGYSSLRPAGGTLGSVTLASGSTTINHAGSISVARGDLVMIIQTQGGNGFSMDQTTTSATYGAVNSYGNAGVYEFRVVLSAPTTTSFVVDRGLTYSYVSTTNTGSGNNARAQVVKVPRYSSLTIDAGASIVPTPWSGGSGRTGGIVAIEVSGSTIINGSIDVSGAGFIGGVAQNSSNATVPSTNPDYAYTDQTRGAAKGEGIAGSTTFNPSTFAVTGTLPGPIFGRGAPANGGGGGNSHNAGGGGGSNASSIITEWTGKGFMQLRPDNPATTTINENTQDVNAWSREAVTRSNSPGGGRGGYSYLNSNQDATITGPGATAWTGDNRQDKGGLGGRPLAVIANSRIFLGGGGGAGDSNNGYGTNGGNGGGLVYLLSNSVSGAGSILSNGIAAPNTNLNSANPGGNDSPGGGGSGGTIIIKTQNLANSVTLNAVGGKGGNQNILGFTTEAEGPGGGGGGGYIAYSNGTPSNISVNGGANGITNAAPLTEFPANGATSGGVGLAASDNTMPDITTDLVITQAAPAGPYYTGQQITITLTATNIGPNSATNVVVTDVLPAGFTFVSSNNTTYNPTNNDNNWNISSLAATNGTASLQIQVIFNANTANAANFYTHTPTINGYQYDSNSNNNTNSHNYTPVNQPPVISNNASAPSATISVTENTTAVTTISATDPEANTITYSIFGGADAAKFTINPTSGTLTFNSTPNFEVPTDVGGNNVYDVIVRATDNGTGALYDEQAIAVTVTNANEPPAAPVDNDATSNTVAENATTGTLVGIIAQATDPDAGTTLTYTLTNDAGGRFAIDPTSGVVTTANGTLLNFEQATFHGITVQVSDGSASSTQTFIINVSNVNEAPVITSNGSDATAAVSLVENTLTVTNVTATDPDAGTTLTYTIIGGADADKFTINANGALAFITAPNFESPTDAGGNNVYDVIVRVTDNGNLFDEQAITVTVTNTNEPPEANDYVNSLTRLNSNSFVPLDPLPGSDDVAVASFRFNMLPNGTTVGQVRVNGVNANTTTDYPWSSYNLISFNPAATNYADATFTYTIKDNEGAIDATPATFTIPINQEPVAVTLINNETLLNTANTTHLVTPLEVSAEDGSILYFRISNLPSATSVGKLYVNGVQVTSTATRFDWSLRDKLSFDPILGRTANSTFQYRIIDNENTESASVLFTIPINGEPVASNTSNAETLLNTAAATLLITPPAGTDGESPVGTPAYFQITEAPASGILTIDNAALSLNTNYDWALANTLRFDPEFTNIANVTFKFTVLDSEGAIDPSPATYTIPINGEPVAENQINNSSLQNSAVITALDALNGTDDGSVATFRFINLPDAAQGVLYVNNIIADQTTAYPWSARTLVSFDPALNNVVNVTFSYVIKDNEGAEDATPALFTIPIIFTDADNDRVADSNDLDDDNDGIPDTLESNNIDPSADNDNDGIENYRDPDFPGGNFNTVTGVNNLFDKDSDGIINAFDLDSDGDGITDVVEQASFGIFPTTDYSANTGRLTSSVGTNGIPSSSTTTTAGSLNDFDGDGLYNFLDMDADNDGLRDYLEAQATPAPPLIIPKGTDTDKDGIDDNYDVTCGCPAPAGSALYPVNTDVDSYPDYLDQNSDDDEYYDAIEAYDNSAPAQVAGYSITELKNLADQFSANAQAAGNASVAGYYNNLADSDNDSVPDWLEDDDEDGRINYLEYGLSYYHDSDNDGWVDLFDFTTFGTEPATNYAYRQSVILVPLPVELLGFTAQSEKYEVRLNWETALEVNNAYFIVERSSNGNTFEAIGKVKGAGTTQQLSTYSFSDKSPLNGTSYYRLRMVDANTTSRTSQVIAVKREGSSHPQFRAFPNPTAGDLFLEVSALVAEEVQVIITDVSGQVVQTRKLTTVIGHNIFDFEITGLRSGAYFIQVKGHKMHFVQRVVKY